MKALGKLSIILVIIFFVSTAVAIATGPVVLFNGFETSSVYQTSNVSMQNINELNVNAYDSELTVHPIKGDNLEAILTGTYAKNRYEYNLNLSVEKSGNSVLVKIVYPNNQIILINKNLKLDIGVPENYSGQLNLETTSGNLKANNLKTEKLSVKSTSGEISIEDINNSGDSSIVSTSGNIDVGNLITSSSKFKSTSGEITITDSENINSIQTTSGNIEVNRYSPENNANFETTSGNIEIDGYSPRNNASFETTSGEVTFNLKDGSSVLVEFKSVSGDLKNSFGDILNGKYNIYVKTTSGNLRIN